MLITLKGIAANEIQAAEAFSAGILELMEEFFNLLGLIPTIRYHIIGLFAAVSERAVSIGMFHALNLHRRIMKQGFVSSRVTVHQLSYVNRSLVLHETWEMSPSVMQVVQNFLNVKELLEELNAEGILDIMTSLAEGGELDVEMTYKVKSLHSTTLRYMMMEEAAAKGMINKSDYKVKSKPRVTTTPTTTTPQTSASLSTSTVTPSAKPTTTESVLADTVKQCSNCKKPQSEETKLHKCGACKRVQYCGRYILFISIQNNGTRFTLLLQRMSVSSLEERAQSGLQNFDSIDTVIVFLNKTFAIIMQEYQTPDSWFLAGLSTEKCNRLFISISFPLIPISNNFFSYSDVIAVIIVVEE